MTTEQTASEALYRAAMDRRLRENVIDRVISRNAKAWAAALISAIAWGYTVVNSAPTGITAHEWLDLAKGAAVALGVYGASNRT